jgi:hypothetical protein
MIKKKKKYVVAAPFWHDGILLAKDSVIWLFPKEAKYRAHALTEEQTTASSEPAAPAAEAKPVKRKPSTAVVVEEAPANGDDNVN